MALLGNTGNTHRNPFRTFGISSPGNERASWQQSGQLLNFSLHQGKPTGGEKTGYPSGRLHPYSWSLPLKPGGLAAVLTAEGVATVSGAMAAGKNAAGTASGIATVSGTAQLVVSGAGTASGVATVSGNILAALSAVGTASGAATTSGAMTALAWASGTVAGAGSSTATIFATGSLSGSITPFTELSPQALAAEVWNASSASYNVSGSMGAKVNAAASAGDPWSTSLPGSYAVGTAGYILGTDLAPDNIATRLLDISDAIEQELTVRKALRLVAASLAGKMSGLDGSTVTIRSAYADDKNRIVATVDADGNRTALTYDLSD